MGCARQLEWLTVAVCACFRQRYTTRSVDLLCRIYSVTYRNNNLGGCCRGATQMQQLGGVTFSHEKAVSTVPLEILQISERRGTILPFIIFSSDAYFPHVIVHHSVFDVPFARGASAGEPGSAPPNRRASAVVEKAPEIDPSRPPVVGLAVSHLARLAPGPGHRQTRNGLGLASCRLSTVLDLEGAVRPTRTTGHLARDPRSDPQDVPREFRLGCTPHPR